MAEERKYIGQTCYICLSSKTELVSNDETIHVPLSVTEYRILSYFIDNIDRPVYLDTLARYVWGPHADEKDPNSLKSQISRVRSKLEKIRVGLRNCIDTNYGLNSYTLKVPTLSETVSIEPIVRGTASSTDIRPATYHELLSLGYTSMDIAESLVKNDLKLYKEFPELIGLKGISPQNEGSASQWARYLASVPDSFKYVINSENEIVGNFSFVSITEEQEYAFKDGRLSESDFTPDETRDLFSAGADHILFLLNLSLNDQYSTLQNNTLLRKLFLEQLLLFAEEDVFFKKIIVNVFKSSHEAFYKQWGFSFVKEHINSGRIYELDMIPYPVSLYRQLGRNRQLKNVNEQLKELYDQWIKL